MSTTEQRNKDAEDSATKAWGKPTIESAPALLRHEHKIGFIAGDLNGCKRTVAAVREWIEEQRDCGKYALLRGFLKRLEEG